MSLIWLVVITLGIVSLFCGGPHAIGTIVLALLKYLIAPVAILIAILAVIKYAF